MVRATLRLSTLARVWALVALVGAVAWITTRKGGHETLHTAGQVTMIVAIAGYFVERFRGRRKG